MSELARTFHPYLTGAEAIKLAAQTFDKDVAMIEPGGYLRRLAVIHANPEKTVYANELKARYPLLLLEDRHTLTNVLRTQQSWMDSKVSETRLAAEARDPDHLRLLRALGFKSEIVVQLRGRGRLLGTITLVFGESGRRYKPTDLALAEELARRAALAVDNALLYREAQTQRERLQVTLRSIADGVIATDVSGQITFLNDVAAALTGWTEAEAIGQDIATVFPMVDAATREAVESPFAHVVREAAITDVHQDHLLVTRDGREIPIEHSGAPIRGVDEETEGVVIVFRDVSERSRIERERDELLRREQIARAQAEQANALKLTFLAMISHELRTPLASIKGFTSTLLATDVEWTTDQQREFLAITEDEVDKLTDLVDQLLDVSRLHAGTLRISPEPQPFERIFRTASAQLQTLTAEHHLTTDIAADLPFVLADSQRIAQVIVNLVDNSVKYSPRGTTITVAARANSNHVQIDVHDEGEGIPPADRPHVFETFRQVDKKVRQKGAGLGLAICKGLIEAHGGEIWIAPETSAGTTISFTLPLFVTQPRALTS